MKLASNTMISDTSILNQPTNHCHAFLFRILCNGFLFTYFFHSAPEEGLYCKPKYRVENNLVLCSFLFNFGHIRRWDQCAVCILL